MKKLHRSELPDTAELTARQEQVIQALLTGVSVQEAAKNLHVGRTTIYRWLKNPAFRAVYHAAQDRSQAWAANQLQRLTVKAIHVLERILDDDETPIPVKIEAARAVLNFALSDKEHAVPRSAVRPPKSESPFSPFRLPSAYSEKESLF